MGTIDVLRQRDFRLLFSKLGLAIWGPVAAAIGISVSLWLAFALLLAAAFAPLAVREIRQLAA